VKKEHDDAVRIPRLWAIVGILAAPVAIGLTVFLRRYRGTDRTAMALAVLVGIGLCLVIGLAWFQRRYGGTELGRKRLRWIGFRSGAIAGVCAGAVGVILLAIRWAIDQLGGPVGEQFSPAFLRALTALWGELSSGLPAYLGAGVMMGSLCGLATAEAIGACSRRVSGDPSPDRGRPKSAPAS
jgi:hypothetical protein